MEEFFFKTTSLNKLSSKLCKTFKFNCFMYAMLQRKISIIFICKIKSDLKYNKFLSNKVPKVVCIISDNL